MIKISDIVGALVRSITVARIQADVVSSQASLEYLKDPVLRAYPVPRAEIQKADIGMKIAVLDIMQADFDDVALTRKSLQDRIPAYVDRVMNLSNPTGASPINLRSAFGVNATRAADIVVGVINEHIAGNPMIVAEDLSKDPGMGAQKLRDVTMSGISNAASILQTGVPFDLFSEVIYREALAFAQATPQSLKTSRDVAGIAGFDLGLAVRRDEVMTVPEYLVSDLRLSVAVENYEWTTTTDAQGNVVNKLTQK